MVAFHNSRCRCGGGKAGMVAFRTVTLVQMWCRYKFELVVTLREAAGSRFPQ